LVRISAHALIQLPAEAKPDVYVPAVKALRRFPDDKPNAAVRSELIALLQKYSGEKIGADAKAWTAWVVKNDPASEKPLNASDGYDATAWGKRLAGIEWAKGDATRGRTAFTKATCAACHDGGSAVGPSLLGISKRFGRDDLLTAILQPSKDVSPRYRPTRVLTTDDKAYTGIIVYEATDGVILQTGADSTVRIAGANIASMKQVEVSLMPTGLIDKLTDVEIADLLSYLATLGDPKMK
jgi:putative heme-binding domain-containing protein